VAVRDLTVRDAVDEYVARCLQLKSEHHSPASRGSSWP
jgi:hypothetical protein